MSNLQVRNLPEDLHARIAARARSERLTMSEWVARTLRKELERPSVDEWVRALRARDEPPRDIDSASVMRSVREATDPDERFDDA